MSDIGKKNYLLTPGPTPVPPEVLLAMSRPIIHHRTPRFKEIFSEVQEGLRYVFQTENEVLVFASSGTGAMESVVSNILSAGQEALTIQGGKFGERWTEICQAYGVKTKVIDVEWGKAVSAEQVKSVLKENPSIQAVFSTLCETSTGVATDIKAISEITKETEAILVVDAISALGAMDCYTDSWGLDVVVAGSQKGLMIPPGLSFVTLSQKAWRRVESSKSPNYYFSYKKYKDALKKDDTPFTPAVSLIIGLRESLRLIREAGIENLIAKYKKMAKAVRCSAEALGLKLFAPESSSDAVTAVKVPAGLDGDKLVKTMRDEYGVTIAGGQASLKGKIFRIATMGFIDEYDLMVCISCLEKVLYQMGYRFKIGAGICAAQMVLVNKDEGVCEPKGVK